jgi:acetyl-CoA carboxylase biotin carboxylase subunit
VARALRCLGEMVVAGVETNIPLFQDLLVNPDIMAGDYNIHWLENWMKAQAEG